jgi:hypothetical protein
MDAIPRVWQKEPADGVQEDGRPAKDRDNKEDSAHNQRVNAETRGNAGADATDPARQARKVKAA